ncbi:AEC family transporter [Methanomicrobium mobile]|uniref:AEC family transporter n=1 Tax=Methanomicrobium mobile TaxID=2205 RepID=UPI0005B274D9|nr:AEC family transporter [Methanomicrobium mobile]
MDILPVADSIIILFLLMGIGFAASKAKFLDRNGSKALSSFLVNIALPCLVVISMQIPVNADTMGKTQTTLMLALVFFAISIAIAVIVPMFIPAKYSERGVFSFMLVFSNLGFMGIPVTQAIFGTDAVFYTTLFMLPFNLLVFTIGILMLRPDMRMNFNPKLFVNPGIIASIIGMLFFFTGFTIPSPLYDVMDYLGSTTTPLAMVVTGALLAMMPLSNLFSDYRIYILSAFRLLIIPVIVYLVISPYATDPVIFAIPVLLAAMPAAANSVILAEEYNADSSLASKGVFITTLLSIVTIPLLAVILM